MGLAKEHLLLATEIVGYAGVAVSGVALLHTTGEVNLIDEQMKAIRTPLVEKFDRDFRANLTIDDLRIYVGNDSLFVKDQKRFTKEQIAQSSEAVTLKTLQETQSLLTWFGFLKFVGGGLSFGLARMFHGLWASSVHDRRQEEALKRLERKTVSQSA